MDQIHLMRVFVAVGDEGSFAAASRKLDISPAAATRAVVALEDMLGVKLLLRTTRNVRFTDAGRQYYDDSRNILTSIADANEAVSGVNAEPRGTLTITAPVLLGRMYVMSCVMNYLQQFPNVKVVAHFKDQVINFVEEGIDVAIRVGNLPNSSLKAIKVGQIRRVLCASPAYLDNHGVPKHPRDLLQHSIVSSSALNPQIEWRFGPSDKPVSVRMDPRLVVTTNDAALVAALGNMGITRLLSYQVKSELEAGALRLVLEEFEEEPWPVHIVHREDKYGSSKVRAFIDCAVKSLRHQSF